MRNRSLSRYAPMALAAVGAAASLALAAAPASAQATGPSQQTIPMETYAAGSGGGSDTFVSNGGQPVRVVDGKVSIRPQATQAEWSTALEVETWKGEGIRYFNGHRSLLLAGYNRGLSENAEIGVVLPFEQVHVNGVFDKTGIGDVELNYRRYFVNSQDENAATVALSGRLFLPTGDRNNAMGLGTWAYGASLNAVQPMGRSSAYAGVGYNLISDKDQINFRNVLYYWAGGVSPVSPKWVLQYEAMRFNSPANEGYSRLLVGARYALTPSVGVQLNVKREFQADGHPTTFSLGYSSRL